MEEAAAAELLLLLSTGPIIVATIVETTETKKEPELDQQSLPQRKRCRKRARLTMRKGARKRPYVATMVPLTVGTVCDTIWPTNGLYYECRIVDFIQIDNRAIYYDVEFTDDHTRLEMIDASRLYVIQDTAKRTRRK